MVSNYFHRDDEMAAIGGGESNVTGTCSFSEMNYVNNESVASVIGDGESNITGTRLFSEMNYVNNESDAATPLVSISEKLSLLREKLTQDKEMAYLANQRKNAARQVEMKERKLKRKEMKALNELSEPKNVGQCYDGASSMSGQYQGLQALIKEKAADGAMFVHCHAHILNLIVCDSAEISILARDTFSILKRMYAFFSTSPERHIVYERNIKLMCNDVVG